MSKKASDAREVAAREGKGWANGTIESLAPAGYSRGVMPVMRRPFRFKAGSVAERAYAVLRDGGAMSEADLRRTLGLGRLARLSDFLGAAIKAEVIRSRRIDATKALFEIGRVEPVL
jgi:hypothetical protein